MKVFPEILSGNLLYRIPFLAQRKRSIVWVEKQECMSNEGDASKSTTNVQKEDDATHATAELALVN